MDKTIREDLLDIISDITPSPGTYTLGQEPNYFGVLRVDKIENERRASLLKKWMSFKMN